MGCSETPMRAVDILGGFWASRRALNAERAIFYQWEQYERRGTIGNFRIAAGLEAGGRRGFFYTDSDLHKWADAAGRILRTVTSPRLAGLLDGYVALMAQAQEPDGYLFTYNQICFPGVRWKNLLIEHELYCLGHFIEAGISHFEATRREDLLALAERSAGLVVREFRDAGPERTSGHEEIELALVRLYRLRGERAYLETARNLLERRGRMRPFWPRFLAQVLSQAWRSRSAAARSGSGGERGFELGENLTRREPPFIALRAAVSFLSGAYQQQDQPIREHAQPRGHAVRWTYLALAAAMLHRELNDPSLLAWLEASWESIVDGKMYVTGGLGSLPVIEGFGRPFELDNRYSYSETCAAIGSILWNREMSLATGKARYADLVEWQLHNAAAVGVSFSGDSYFYRNPLSANVELQRKPWYATACCPSNLSRLWADLDRLAAAQDGPELRIDQYFSCRIALAGGARISIDSAFPWEGKVRIELECPSPMKLRLRKPGWADAGRVLVDGTERLAFSRKEATRSGLPRFGKGRFERADYLELAIPEGSSFVELEMPMEIGTLSADPRVRPDRGRVAVTRGPLVFCAESLDNQGLELRRLRVVPGSLEYEFAPRRFGDGCGVIRGETREGQGLVLIPYFAWGNRGASSMEVWLRA